MSFKRITIERPDSQESRTATLQALEASEETDIACAVFTLSDIPTPEWIKYFHGYHGIKPIRVNIERTKLTITPQKDMLDRLEKTLATCKEAIGWANEKYEELLSDQEKAEQEREDTIQKLMDVLKEIEEKD